MSLKITTKPDAETEYDQYGADLNKPNKKDYYVNIDDSVVDDFLRENCELDYSGSNKICVKVADIVKSFNEINNSDIGKIKITKAIKRVAAERADRRERADIYSKYKTFYTDDGYGKVIKKNHMVLMNIQEIGEKDPRIARQKKAKTIEGKHQIIKEAREKIISAICDMADCELDDRPNLKYVVEYLTEKIKGIEK